MQHDAVKDYLDGPFREIGGWCSEVSWLVIQPLAEAMAENGPLAPIAEIGVHHGKFFIGLLKTAGNPSGNLAIDVFGDQELNIDKSGKGGLGYFKRNLALCGVSKEAVTIVKGDSLGLSPRALAKARQAAGDGFSFFSVDGGHRAEHVFLDTELAESLTAHSGVIMIDDYYNPRWPGVQEGICRRYILGQPRFVPLAFIGDKLFLCHLSFHERYLDRLRRFLAEHHPAVRTKMTSRFGYDSLTIDHPGNEASWVAMPGAREAAREAAPQVAEI